MPIRAIFGTMENDEMKLIYLNRNDNICSGRTYDSFLNYAFSKTDYFMLVYVNYYGKGYTSQMKQFEKQLKPFEVKRRTNPSWPGTLETFSPNTTYKVVFYQTDDMAKKVLKNVNGLFDWTRPLNPQDLAFFKRNKCWFYSVAHEGIAAIMNADEEDFAFLEKNGLAKRENSIEKKDDVFLKYNEVIERQGDGSDVS